MRVVLLIAVLFTCNAFALGEHYFPLLKKYAHNPSREAALTEQESAWNPFAESPYAQGLRQFTRSTGKWLSTTLCRDLGPFKPFEPVWSLRCGIRYAEKLQENNRYGGYCLNRRIAEQEYNGGGWVIRELKQAENHLGLAHRICITGSGLGKKRAKWACKENYEYPLRIDRKQPKYASLGGKICGQSETR